MGEQLNTFFSFPLKSLADNIVLKGKKKTPTFYIFESFIAFPYEEITEKHKYVGFTKKFFGFIS